METNKIVNSIFKLSIYAKKSDKRKLVFLANKLRETKDRKLYRTLLIRIKKLLHDRHAYHKTGEYLRARRSSKATAKYKNKVIKLTDTIIYVKICPLDLFNDTAAYNKYAKDAISKIIKFRREIGKKVKYIVDLRQNYGGLIARMVQISAHVSRNIRLSWLLKKYHFDVKPDYANSELVCQGFRLSVKFPSHEPKKIALLMDNTTASAGEMTAIGFIGSANVRTFGSKTYGVPTFISGVDFKFGDMIGLSSGITIDKKGRKYCDELKPNVKTETPLYDALVWLRH